jgi:hypothetical protein
MHTHVIPVSEHKLQVLLDTLPRLTNPDDGVILIGVTAMMCHIVRTSLVRRIERIPELINRAVEGCDKHSHMNLTEIIHVHRTSPG